MDKNKKYKYFGRYCHSTGFYTDVDGKRWKCTWPEYLDMVEQERGLEVARRIKMRYEKRKASKGTGVELHLTQKNKLEKKKPTNALERIALLDEES